MIWFGLVFGLWCLWHLADDVRRAAVWFIGLGGHGFRRVV